MHETPLKPGVKYGIKNLTKSTRCVVERIKEVMDVSSLSFTRDRGTLGLNDIGKVSLKTMAPLAFDTYQCNRTTGGFILIDEASNATVAAGMVTSIS